MNADFLYRLAADAVVFVHLSGVVFILFGGFLVWRWKWTGWVHVPIFLWGALIHFTGWICPLTPLENYFRVKSGGAAYEGSFVEHYILSLVVSDRTYVMQILIGLFVLVINVIPYGVLFLRPRLIRYRPGCSGDRLRVP